MYTQKFRRTSAYFCARLCRLCYIHSYYTQRKRNDIRDSCMRERCFKIDIAFAKLQTPSKFRVSIESRRTRRVILSFCFPEQRLLMWQTSPLASRRRNRYQEDTQQGLRVRHLVVTVRPTCCMGPRIIFFLFLFGRQSTRTVVSILGKGRRDNRIYKSRNFHIPVYLDREYARSCTRT